MRSAALNLAALSFTIAGASACASQPEPTSGTAAVVTTDPTYLAAPSYVPGQTFFTTDPAYFESPTYVAYPTYSMAPGYIAIGGLYRHRHACGHRASHTHRR
jgi:hypothetical protein